MNRWEKHLASKRGLCSGCGKVHYMGFQGLIRLTKKGWCATNPGRRQGK